MDSLFDLTDKHVLIAGEAGGIGSEITRTLGQRCGRMTLVDRDAVALGKLQHAQTSEVSVATLDITDEPSCAVLFNALAAEDHAPDVVLNAAGVLPICPADTLDPELFRSCYDDNVTGALILSQCAARATPENQQLSIIHIASVSSAVANPGYAAYASSKAALSQLVRVLAREWAPRNIRVNAVGPALIEAPLTDGYLSDAEFRQQAIASIPMGRLARVVDIIPTIVLLASAGGAFITGQTIYVDGGRTLV